MRRFLFSSVAAGLMGGAMLLSGAAPVSAAALPSIAVTTPLAETALVQDVNKHRSRRGDRSRYSRRYDRNRHGHRYRQARRGYRHHHGGFYYASPWWIGPSIGFALTVPSLGYGGGGGHVEWCLNRFRSYDPASDTYLGYDGFRHRCNSPFR